MCPSSCLPSCPPAFVRRSSTAAHEFRLRLSVASLKTLCGEKGLNIYVLATLLERKGWGFFTGQNPPTLGIPIGERTPHLLEGLLADLRECVKTLRANPELKAEGNAAVYGAAASIPEPILEDVLRGYVDIRMTVKPTASAGA